MPFHDLAASDPTVRPVHGPGRQGWALIAKRTFDLVFAALGLALLSPFLLAIGIAIRLETPGPVFFRQERVGRFRKTFRIHKFRTMVADAERQGPTLTRMGDARVTRVGAFLRQYKLDEFPQLIDVVKGDMSLVGARPELAKYVQFYPERAQELIFSLPPGITDLASIAYKEESNILAASADPERDYIERILPAKVGYYEDYAKHRSLWGDVIVILQTLKSLFT
jgi:lipopolysaccharide/colanic/teichoic acid biosynthesis glycosyltransferase